MSFGKNAVVIKQTKDMLEVLNSHQFRIMEAESGIDGIRKTIRYNPDLIVTEIDIPSLNGLSMAKILTILHVNTPIIFASSEEKYKKHSASYDNVAGYILTSAGQKKNLGPEFESAIQTLSLTEITKPKFKFNFRQHEWANLIGKSEKRKILIIEDDESFRLLTLKYLDNTDRYELFIAKDGLEGVFKALLVNPDLILADIMMPLLDGMAMSQVFNILGKSFPIVFLSVKDDSQTQQKATKTSGVIGYLNKKIVRDKDVFLRQIDKYLMKTRD